MRSKVSQLVSEGGLYGADRTEAIGLQLGGN